MEPRKGNLQKEQKEGLELGKQLKKKLCRKWVVGNDGDGSSEKGMESFSIWDYMKICREKLWLDNDLREGLYKRWRTIEKRNIF